MMCGPLDPTQRDRDDALVDGRILTSGRFSGAKMIMRCFQQ